MDPTKVLIVESEFWLGQAIGSLLTTQGEWQISQLYPQNEAELLQEMDHFKPDVVIIDEGLNFTNLQDVIMTILEQNPDMRILLMGLNDNQVEVYEKQVFIITKSSDIFGYLNQNRR